jgi:sugar O-acyltransferase (sialic acid O-acetyltransferase NeuD family)
VIDYVITEFGVTKIESERVTFIPALETLGAWRDFETWCSTGNSPKYLPKQPSPEYGLPKKLWIIGAGGFGREIFGMSQTALGQGIEWRVAGFLNDIPDALDGFTNLPSIAGDTGYRPTPEDVFICAIGDISGRKSICESFSERRAQFVNLIQQSATISGEAHLGRGIIVEAYSGIGANTRIGDFSTVLSHVSIAHDVALGRFCQVSPFASILGRAQIGEGVLIGSHAVILPDIVIGAGATVGAGSVVIQNVPDGATIFGVPARQIK